MVKFYSEVNFAFGMEAVGHLGSRDKTVGAFGSEWDFAVLFPCLVPKVALDERLESLCAALYKETLHSFATEAFEE